MIEINERDFGTLAISAVRYTLQGRTYMPSVIQNLLRPKLSELNYYDLFTIASDICSAAELGNLGDEADAYDWMLFRMAVEEEMDAQRAKEESDERRKVHLP